MITYKCEIQLDPEDDPERNMKLIKKAHSVICGDAIEGKRGIIEGKRGIRSHEIF